MIKHAFLTYHDDGAVEIFGNREGLPEITGVVPAPDCNTKDETERQKRFDEACDQITLQGYYIKSKRRIRNKTFDDPGQQTTLKIVYRPCKTEEELKSVHTAFMGVIGKYVKKRDDAFTQEQIERIVKNPDFLEIS